LLNKFMGIFDRLNFKKEPQAKKEESQAKEKEVKPQAKSFS